MKKTCININSSTYILMQAVLSRAGRALAWKRVLRTSVAPLATTAGGEGAGGRKLYELRTYSIKPARTAEFLKMSNEHMNLRMAHSKLIGYWTCELGGLNEVVHIWEYG